LAKRTVGNYEYHFSKLVEFVDGDSEFSAISTRQIRRYLDWLHDEKGLSKRTVYDSWIALSSLWTWANAELRTDHVIRGKINEPSFTEKEIDPFSREEIKALIDAIDYSNEWESRKGKKAVSKRPTAARDRAIVATLLDSGIRASELCALIIADYDQKRGRLNIRHGKGDKQRFVFLGDRSRKAIWKYMAERPDAKTKEPLFATQTGNHLDRNNLRHLLQNIAERADVENVHPHRFRHTFAIMFLRNGGNVFELQKILGHENLKTVQRYAKLAEIDLEMARDRSPVDNWRI
jgi:integrase/recombinase XerD